jgi:hypothetical protein
MTAFGQFAKPAALVVAVASFMCLSGTAQAETGWLWFDSIFAAPHAAPGPIIRQPVKRMKVVRPAAAAPAPRPILVSVAAPEQNSSCFWCTRPVFISGLSF